MTSKISKWIFLSFYIVFLFSCSYNEHIQEDIHSDYEHIQDNFYRDSRFGKIYYKSKEEDAFTYNEVQYNIDFKTMIISGEYILDKDSVYYFYDTTSGTFIFKYENADRKSFHVLKGGYYAKDKNIVYSTRGHVIENADIHSFEPIIDPNFDPGLPLGRDKNNIYVFDEVITDLSEIEGLNEYIMKNPL